MKPVETKTRKIETLADIETVVSEAWTTTKLLFIEDYCNSSGDKSTMVVQLLGPNGYKEVLTKSLEAISKGKVDLNVSDGVGVGAQAAAALAASWSKSLNGLHAKRKMQHQLPKQDLEQYGCARNHKDEVVITNVAVLVKFTSNTSGNISNTPLVRAKRELSSRLPMGMYRGQLNLSPTKISNISVTSPELIPK